MEIKELKASLGKKISYASKSFGKVTEDGENKHSKYMYVSSNKMVMLLREKLPEFGLCIIPEVEEFSETSTTFTNNNGSESTWIRTVVKMNFEIIDTETGYSVVKKFFGADQDTGGKSSGQAITECTKRFYFKLFNISSKDETDPDEKTTQTPRIDNKIEKTATPEIIKEFLNNVTHFKIYGKTKKSIYYQDVKYAISNDQEEWLKKHPKYKEQNGEKN